jgi:ATP-dependent DNA helicase RecG
MKEKDKNLILERFNRKEFDILVATPVIEVGIDIKDATVIIVESAERFGLAQLHQLRGRVGRSDKKSYCLLFSSNNTFPDRLKFFAQTELGIKLAEFDLQSRGPGEVYGTRQSGIPKLKIANIMDIELVKKAREAIKLIEG